MHRRRVSGLGILVMGAVVLAFGLVLIYTIIKIWPALQADAKPGKPLKPFVKISWFDREYNLTQEKALLLVVVFSGALGAFLHVATSFSDYVGNRRLMRSWLWFYILRPVVGAGLALLFYFAVRGGLFTTSAGSSDLNPYGMAALGAMVGLFSKQATNKLQQIFDTAFSVGEGEGDDARGDSIGNPDAGARRHRAGAGHEGRRGHLHREGNRVRPGVADPGVGARRSRRGPDRPSTRTRRRSSSRLTRQTSRRRGC